MVPLRLDVRADRRPVQNLQPNAMAFLNHLRFMAMACRAKPRTDLFEACALLHGCRDAARTAHAEALMRCLAQALGKPARLHAPGTVELTFDEAWLVQLGQAIRDGDNASATFLIHSRVAHEHRRLVRFLVGHVTASFAAT